MYSGLANGGAVPTPALGNCLGIDMICYSRILQDNGQINVVGSPGTNHPATPTALVGITDATSPFYNYTSFDSWRNPASGLLPPYNFSISTYTTNETWGSAPRRSASKIELTGTLYAQQYTDGDLDYNDLGVQSWHEPVYAVNLYDSTQNVPNAYVQTYYETGAYVKIESIIGISDGKTTQFYLVDERWADCIPAVHNYDPTATALRFIFVKDPIGITTPWMNVTYYVGSADSPYKCCHSLFWVLCSG